MSRSQRASKSKQLKMPPHCQDIGSKFCSEMAKDEKYTKWQFQMSARSHWVFKQHTTRLRMQKWKMCMITQGTRQQICHLLSIMYTFATSVVNKITDLFQVWLPKQSITDLMCNIIKSHFVVNPYLVKQRHLPRCWLLAAFQENKGCLRTL